MGWFFIVAGVLFFTFAFGALLVLYFKNPLTKYRWERRIARWQKAYEARRESKLRKKKIKELNYRKVKKETELEELSERDIERIQRRGLRYRE